MAVVVACGCARRNPDVADAGAPVADLAEVRHAHDLARADPDDLTVTRVHDFAVAPAVDLAQPITPPRGDMAVVVDPPMVDQIPGVMVATLAGSNTAGGTDGTGTAAQFDNPVGVTLDASGRLYVTEYDGNRVRIVDVNGSTATLVPADVLHCPFGITEPGGDALIVQTDCDADGNKNSSSGTLWRVPKSGDPPTMLATGMNRPRGLCDFDTNHIIVADRARDTVSLMSLTTGMLALLAGAPDQPGYADGSGMTALFDNPTSVGLLADESIVVSDGDNNRLRRVTLGGAVSTLAGASDVGAVDGTTAQARFWEPWAVCVDIAGDVFISDLFDHRIRRMDTSGHVRTVAGDGNLGFRDGTGDVAEFYGQEGLACSGDGKTLWVADGNLGAGTPFHRVRIITIP